MRLPRECYQMKQVIETHLTHLSGPQLTGLVLWVCGTIQAGSSCQNAVATALSTRGNWNSIRQYLREWLFDGSHRARPCKTQLDVSLCFAPLLRWVLVWWRSDKVALAIDPTLKGVERNGYHRHRHQRGLPELRHSRGLAHPACEQTWGLDGPDSRAAPGAGPGGAAGHERDCAV